MFGSSTCGSLCVQPSERYQNPAMDLSVKVSVGSYLGATLHSAIGRVKPRGRGQGRASIRNTTHLLTKLRHRTPTTQSMTLSMTL